MHMSILTRRDFLRTSVALAAGLVLSDCGSVDTGNPISERKTVNVTRQPTSVTPEDKESGVYLSIPERLYGLSLIWKEAAYNFAFFDRIPELDWDAAYREYIPQAIAAEDLFA